MRGFFDSGCASAQNDNEVEQGRKLSLTKLPFSGYNGKNKKSCEQKSMLAEAVREPCLVEMGTIKQAEHGLGAGVPIGRHFRVRPLKRQMRRQMPQIKVVPR